MKLSPRSHTKQDELVIKLRGALQRHGQLVNHSMNYERLCKMVEKINKRPLSKTLAERSKQLHAFVEREISHDLPKRPWRDLNTTGYSASLRKLQEMSEYRK